VPTALLFDIHGNLLALEAVLGDASDRGVDRYLLGGDYVLFGAWPAQTLARVRALTPAAWIRGNVDRWTAGLDEVNADPDLRRAVDFVRDAIGTVEADQLGALPPSVEVDSRTRAWHASPTSDMRSFLPEPADDEAELLTGVAERRLVFGHTHLPFARTSSVRGVELVNPGSVGMPLDGDHRAAYAILHDDGAIQQRRVAYDHAAAAAAVRASDPGSDWSGVMAQRLERATLA
jgi:predicted phosphodiesterase